MKYLKSLVLAGFLVSFAVQANDDDLSDWVVVPNGHLIFKNNLAQPISLLYQVPGVGQGMLQVKPKTSARVDVSAYQIFASSLKVIWNSNDVIVFARKHLGDEFARKYGVAFKCESSCCSVGCQSESLIRSFQAKKLNFAKSLAEYKESLADVKVGLEFSQDANGQFVTTTIGNFTRTNRFK